MFESFFKSLETSEELINFSEIYDATIMTLLLRNQLKGIYETYSNGQGKSHEHETFQL